MSRRWRNFQGSIDSACWKGIGGITGHNVEREEIKMWQKEKTERNCLYSICKGEPGFRGGSVVKNRPARQEPQVRTLGWEDPLEKEIATHSSLLAWGIP